MPMLADAMAVMDRVMVHEAVLRALVVEVGGVQLCTWLERLKRVHI